MSESIGWQKSGFPRQNHCGIHRSKVFHFKTVSDSMIEVSIVKILPGAQASSQFAWIGDDDQVKTGVTKICEIDRNTIMAVPVSNILCAGAQPPVASELYNGPMQTPAQHALEPKCTEAPASSTGSESTTPPAT